MCYVCHIWYSGRHCRGRGEGGTDNIGFLLNSPVISHDCIILWYLCQEDRLMLLCLPQVCQAKLGGKKSRALVLLVGWVGDSAWNSHCTGIRSALERNGQTLIGQLLKRSWTCNGLKSNAHSKIVKGPIQSAASFLRIEYFIFSSIYVTLVKFNLIKELSSLCGRTWAILASGV